MQIYTASCGGEKLKNAISRNVGILLTTGSSAGGYKKAGAKVAIDNGAFTAWQRGFPFPAVEFREHLRGCFKNGINADFIVCPDIVTAGKISLSFSMKWAAGELLGGRLALAVQDGVKPSDIDSYMLNHFTYIFVGGSQEWKWQTLEMWVEFAHKNNKKVHVGGVGTLNKLKHCESIGVDSVDSSSFARNDAWDIIDAFNGNKQESLI